MNGRNTVCPKTQRFALLVSIFKTRAWISFGASIYNNGFKIWQKRSASLKSHHESVGHKFALETWSEFKQKQKSGVRIANMLDKGHSELVMENRKYMEAVVECLCYTACQEIAERGHSVGKESSNRGNFHEFLHVIGMLEATVDKTLASNPSNAKYIPK